MNISDVLDVASAEMSSASRSTSVGNRQGTAPHSFSVYGEDLNSQEKKDFVSPDDVLRAPILC